MSERMTITHYREVTEIARYDAEVDPRHYVEWCKEAGYEATELWALQEYLMEGHGDSEYKESTDVTGSEFRDFEDAEYANELVAAAGAETPGRTDEELRRIARGEVHRHGTQTRSIEVLQKDRDLTEADAHAVRALIHGASVTL